MLPEETPILCLAVGALTEDYVTKLESMLRRNFPRKFRLICITDRPRPLPSSIQTIDASQWPGPRPGMRPTTYKLFLYDRQRVPIPEFLYLDTSMVIRADMSPLIQFADAQAQDLITVRDWNYDAYNTSVMRIRQTDRLAEIPKAYEAGETFVQRVPGDQDFVTGLVRTRGFEDNVTTFPDELVACFGAARKASRRGSGKGQEMLEQAVVVKFNGRPKMHELIDPRYRLRQILETRNPLHRRAWFWVKETKDLWK